MRVDFSPKVRRRAGAPPIKAKNVYYEPIEELGLVPVQRPGVVASAELGNGPVRLITWFQGSRYVLSGNTLYKDGTSHGTVSIGGYYQFAQSESELVLVAGWNAYRTDGTALTQITDPDLGQVSGVQFLAGIFVYPQRDLSEFVYSEVDSASTIAGLAFANAEKDPDPIVRVIRHSDNLWFFGTRTIEPQYATGDSDLPFVRSSGQGYDKGCPAPYSIVQMDNSLIFVGSEKETGYSVYRGEATPQDIGTPFICEQLRKCEAIGSVTGVPITIDRHALYLLNIPGRGSWAYDFATQLWAEWSSYGRDLFRLQCGDAGVFGDDTTGELWMLDPDVFTDDGEPIIREVSCWIGTTSPTVDSAVKLVGAYGVGLATGQGSEPVVEMRYSNGGLGNWSSWQSASLGVQGDYEASAAWFQQGMITAPGRLLEFRCSDPIRFSPYHVVVGAMAYA